ncbi:MAG: hypothetical protein KDK65_05965 [Chlamydiia bacterium]|nr:hypothetical protein [Chlamydiia bacterium]
MWVGGEEEVQGESVEEALRLAWRKVEGFRPFHCGMRFTLPERDEIGMEAYYWQMAKALEGNGVYFDEELGHSCSVREISLEAKELYRELSQHGGNGTQAQ